MLSLNLTNIYAEGRKLFLFHRVGRELKMITESTFFPYFYHPSSNGIFRGIYGQRLSKIFTKAPYEIRNKKTEKSMEADVIYIKRYLLDKINITKSELRWIMFDIETKSKQFPNPSLAKDMITCITCYDNYDKEYITFYINDYKSEDEMLQSFIDYIREKSPDILCAYNAYGFDYPYLCNRITDFPQKISPINKLVKKNNFPAGMSILDYYQLVKKVYKYKKYKLEYVYCDTFKLPYKPEKYRFDEVNEKIKQKNKDDVRKMIELEQKLKLIPYFDELRRISKVLWEDLTSYSVLVDGLMLQTAKQKGIILSSKPSEEVKFMRMEEDEIKGGYVHAESGLYENVYLLDVGGTYPNLIKTFNLDPANKRKEANEQTTTVRNVHILQNSNAVVPTVCSRLINSRKEIQKQLETVTGEEYELLKQKDAAHKSLNNTVYGVLLFKSSRLYDKDIASTITYLARFLIRYTKWYLNHSNAHVIAADTDSVFVKSDKDYNEIQNTINKKIIPKWLNHFGKTEGTLSFKYEGTFKNLFILTKKHYIGNIIKANGEEKKVIKGIEALRSDSSKFQEIFQEILFDKILAKESKVSIINWIQSKIERMKTLPLTEVSFPCKLSKSVESYKTESIHIRALRYAQEDNSDWEVNVGDDYYYCFIISMKNETHMIKKDLIQTYDKDGNERGFKNITAKRLEKVCEKTTYKYGGNIRYAKKMGSLSNEYIQIINELKEGGLIITKEVETKGKARNVMAFDDFRGIGRNEVNWNAMIERNIMKKVKNIFEALNWDVNEIENKSISERVTIKVTENVTKKDEPIIETSNKIKKESEKIEKKELKAYYEE